VNEAGRIAFDRELPNGVTFGGRVSRAGSAAVDLELFIRNGKPKPDSPTSRCKLCAFLRAIREFGDYIERE